MSLEALIGGKISIFIWLPCLNSDLLTTISFSRRLWQVQ
jgi:hypothetical protein